MNNHEYTSGGASWNPAFRLNSHHDTPVPQLQEQEHDQQHDQQHDQEYDQDQHTASPTQDQTQPTLDHDSTQLDHDHVVHEQSSATTEPEADNQLASQPEPALSEAVSEQSQTVNDGQGHGLADEPEPEQLEPETHPSVPLEQSSSEDPGHVLQHAAKEADTQTHDPNQALDTAPQSEPEQAAAQEEPLLEETPVQIPESSHELLEHTHSPPGDETPVQTQESSRDLLEYTHSPPGEETPVQTQEPSHDLLEHTHSPPGEDTTSDDQPTLHDLDAQNDDEPTLHNDIQHSDPESQRAGNEYEYQGGNTVADEATAESAELSLLQDEEDMPTAQDNPSPGELGALITSAAPLDADQEEPPETSHAFDFGDADVDDTFDALVTPSQQYEQQYNYEQEHEQQPEQLFEEQYEQQLEKEPEQHLEEQYEQQLGQEPEQQLEQEPEQHLEQQYEQQLEQEPEQHLEQQPEQQLDHLSEQLPEQQHEDHPEQHQHHQDSGALDWDNVEDDDTFGALVSQQKSHENDIGSLLSPDEETHVNENGAVAASRATVLDQVAKEMNDDQETSDNPKEADLAAMWQAALDDDEFLDEATSVDPSAFFGDDDEGFLEDSEPSQTAHDITSPSQPVSVVDAQGRTTGFTAAAQIHGQINSNSVPSPGVFSSPQMPAMAAAAAAAAAGAGIYGAYGQVPTQHQQHQQQQQPQRPAALSSAQSFVAKSKGGYSSPYDLPEDIVQPRIRPARREATPLSQPTVPPPRTTSMTAIPPPLPHASSTAPFATATPPVPISSSQPLSKTLTNPPPPSGSTGKNASGFFEELPVVPKIRSRPSGVYTPAPAIPSVLPLQTQPPRAETVPPPSTTYPTTDSSHTFGGLQQPERLPLLPDNAPQQLQPPHLAPPASTRYSPAPPGTAPAVLPASSARFSPAPPNAPPPAASRYSPAPPAQASVPAQTKYAAAPPAPRPGMPFAPRTSSPLAYADKPLPEHPTQPLRALSYQPSSAPGGTGHGPPTSMDSTSRRGSEQPEYGVPLHPVGSRGYASTGVAGGLHRSTASPPVTMYVPSVSNSPESRKSLPYTPVESTPSESLFSPPQRPRTQSPGTTMKVPLKAMAQAERPISAMPVTSPTMTHQQDTTRALHPARRQFSADLTYAPPHDERAADGLERWRGCPIIRWSPGGSLITSFPKQAPFYAVGHAIPTIKCAPGPITLHETKDAFPMDDRDTKFPGPLNLKGKGKKKDVLAWLSGKIEDLERLHEGALLDFGMSTLLKHRVEEKVVLWKMTKLFLEHDNKVEGNAVAELEARNILLPNLAQTQDSAEELSTNADLGLKSEPVTGGALAQIRKRLLEGKREDAIWYAAEKRLWSHALLIASVGGPELWKQVVQEFVRAQVKDAGENAQSLAALYEVFAGNWEESIDELVPPSARAGFQMISKSVDVGSSAKNPLDGLDHWRETLGLIVSNRSNGDIQAIAALGRLLSKYGRVEAAHTCFLFARASANWSGADDAASDFVLLGADHQNQPHELAINLDSILLTEVYEYVLSLTPVSGTSAIIPHLQAYKLHHARILTEHGLRREAQAYCEAIGSALKSSTRASPYYHMALMVSVDDLNRCLSAAPQPSSSSWIPKPSMDKVSGSMWKRFNTFVAGDEDDQAPAGSGPGAEAGNAAGPFGMVSGDTPTISREGSSADLYSAMSMNGMTAGAGMMSTSAPGRYAPGNTASTRVPPEHAAASKYAPQTPQSYTGGRTSLESTRSDIPERPGTGYSVYTGLQPQPPQPRSNSTPFGAYLPQAQPISEIPSQALSVPRPVASRAASDYRVQYDQAQPRRESTQSTAQSTSGYSPRPSIDHSAIPARPSMEQSRSSYGFSQEPVHTGSLYQPGGSYTPSAPAYGFDTDSQPERHGSQSYEPGVAAAPATAQQTSDQPQTNSFGYKPPQASYEPVVPSFEPQQQSSSYEPHVASYEPPTSSYQPSSYAPPEPGLEDDPEAMTSSYEPPDSSYAPPTSSYDPPSYQPYEPEPDPEDQADTEDAPSKPKKKSIMDLDDDDDELAARAAALKAQQKRDADRQADEAFRAAAEADAERDRATKDQGQKKGWLTGWFKKSGEGGGSGGSGGGLDAQQANKPIRAKLGEENSFYYDPDLKKWVNKKAGSTTPEASAPTPPPPRGPPSRTVSTAGGAAGPPPPSGPPSRIGTPAAGTGTPPMPPGAVPPGQASGPPSRPPTGMSNANSIDDLLGAPAPRKGGAGGTKKGKRGGRYVDVMAK